MNKKDKRSLILFFILTFTISWSIWIVSGVLTREGDFIYDHQWLLAQVGVFTPSIAGVVLTVIRINEFKRIYVRILLLFLMIFMVGLLIATNKPHNVQEFTPVVSISVIIIALITIIFFTYFKKIPQPYIKHITERRIKLKWILLALVFFPILFLIGWLIVNIQGQEYFLSKNQINYLEFLKILCISFALNLILGGSIGEELGWRGFALPLLFKKFNPLIASLILGIIWAGWHFPIDINSDSTIGPLVVIHRIIWTIPVTIIFTWFYIKTNGSLLIAILLHTSINILSDLGFRNYESSIMIMTLILIVVASFISFRSEMRTKLKKNY